MASRFIATDKGLVRVDEDGRKTALKRKDVLEMRNDLDLALAHYRPTVDEKKKDFEAAQKDVDRADFWRKASAATGLACAVGAAASQFLPQATEVGNTVWNIRRDPPIVRTTQLRPAFRSQFAIRALNVSFLGCGAMMLVCARSYFPAAEALRHAGQRVKVHEETFHRYEGEQRHLTGLLANVEEMLDSVYK
eukprot:TRINITY_DN5204_c0_g1_i1.p1 TRINITY_DN5204_c0_g1~~TRINITY_DN5204_c0_g1_i1.p1  ORF type:complete len:192 (+),score=54.48 TRINITY_DN5204_c0_g1_i1:64-639(+)